MLLISVIPSLIFNAKGEKPPPGKIIHSLQERDWFIYCGHGSGGLLVDRDDVASLPSCSRGDSIFSLSHHLWPALPLFFGPN